MHTSKGEFMTNKPKCILVTGRPGSGKSTLIDKLSKKLYLPKISRDEFKEGYVNTFGVKHDKLPKETNGVVNQVFFDTILNMLKGNISLIIEAAFDHKNMGLYSSRYNGNLQFIYNSM